MALLKAGHLNVRSLTCHLNAVADIIIGNNLDLCGISESWLTNSIPDVSISIPEYSLIRRDRQGRGGGVCIYLKSSIKNELISCSDQIEQLWIKIKGKSNTVAYGVAYRSQAENFRQFWNCFEMSLSGIYTEIDNVICMGDFNTDLLNCDNYMTKYLLDVFESIGLHQIVHQPTRISGACESLLDYILVTDTASVQDVNVLPVVDIADHELTVCSYRFSVGKSKPLFKTFRNFNFFNYELFDSHLRAIPWRVIYDFDDVDSKVSFLNESLTTLLDTHAPYVTKRITKKSAPWLTASVRQMMRDRDKILSRFKRTKGAGDWVLYKVYKNLINTAITTEKKAYYNNIFKSKNQRDTWSSLKELHLKPEPQIPPCLSDPDDINNYYTSSTLYTVLSRMNR